MFSIDGVWQKIGWLVLALMILASRGMSQSLEIMAGTQHLFADVQWLEFIGEKKSWSLFSRTRATWDYDKQTDLFTGAYVNYTTKAGVGLSVVGRLASAGAGADAGIHYFRGSQKFLVYALAAIEMRSPWRAYWFSICRYTPKLGKNWEGYGSLEWYTAIGGKGHEASVQRLRAGLGRNRYQFGLALNIAAMGRSYTYQSGNPGLFIRKSF